MYGANWTKISATEPQSTDNALNKVLEATITFIMDEEVSILDHSEYSLTWA